MTVKETEKQKMPLGHMAKTYVERFLAHRILIKRALFKGPKRILQEAHTKIHIIDKIKTFFGQISGSVWILIASGAFLLYAAWSTFGPKKITAIALHPASDTIKSTIVAPVQIPTVAAPIINNEIVIEENQETLIQETIVEIQAPVVVATLQHIYNMYDAINNNTYIPADYFDTYMQTSDFVKTYFTTKRLVTLRNAIQGGISVVSAEEFPTERRDRIGVRYTISYKLTNNQKTFTEILEVILRPQAGGWRIGTVKCESRGCSINPFFNMEKYGL